MDGHRYDASSPFPLELIELGNSTWRVSDVRYVDGDPRQILGYLAEAEGEFEMVWMRPRIGVRYLYPTREDAVRAIVTRLSVSEPR